MITLQELPGFEYEKFASYADLEAHMLNSPAVADSRVTVHDLGVCSDGINHIWGFSIGGLDKKPVIFMQHQIHGRHEWRCSHWGFKFFEKMVNGNIPDKALLNEVLSKVSFFVIPCLNPYGYENDSYGNADNVNLNRNYDYKFDEFIDDGSYYGTTKGAFAFSEPETQVSRDIIQNYKPFMFIDTHTRGGQELASIYPGALEYNKYQYPMYREIANSLRIMCNLDGIGFLNGTDRPEAHAWGSTNTSKAGIQTLATTFEVPELTTEYDMARIGMSGLWLFTVYATRYYQNRLLRQS